MVTKESKALVDVVSERLRSIGIAAIGGVWQINDGVSIFQRLGRTPRKRILAILKTPPDKLTTILNQSARWTR